MSVAIFLPLSLARTAPAGQRAVFLRSFALALVNYLVAVFHALIMGIVLFVLLKEETVPSSEFCRTHFAGGDWFLPCPWPNCPHGHQDDVFLDNRFY